MCVSGGCCSEHWQRLQGSALPQPILLLCHGFNSSHTFQVIVSRNHLFLSLRFWSLINCRHYSSLSFLSLGHCIQFTSKGLFSITSGKGCRRLSYLDRCGCTQLLADGLGYISKGCQILNTLVMDDIPDCDDAMIFQLALHCRTLRHISFMGGSKVGDKGFKYLVTENKRLQTMKIESEMPENRSIYCRPSLRRTSLYIH